MNKFIFLTGEQATTTPSEQTTLESILSTILQWIATEGVKLLIGVILLLIIFYIINVFSKKIKKRMTKKNRDKILTNVVYRVTRIGLKIITFVGFLGFVGIDTAGIGGVITSCGVAIGLALQGSLSNLAGGVIILLMRPFKIGDYIESQGEGGTVEDIHIFYTYLATPDNKVVMIPNGTLVNDTIINYSTKEYRRVDLVFSISYTEDFEKAKQVIWDVIDNTENILMDPKPFVRVKGHSERIVEISVKVWTKNSNYWGVYFDLVESIKVEFDNANIKIPYKELDVHIKEK